jgi:two-component system NtrC family sensor kinase
MSAIKARLALIDRHLSFATLLEEHEYLAINETLLASQSIRADILLINAAQENLDWISANIGSILNQSCSKIVLVLQENIEVDFQKITNLRFDHFIFQGDLGSDFLHSLWENLRQKEQDETYLSLSSELNQQYESLKKELEFKLNEKSKNIIESRKQIYEINNRVEVLRKSLYSTTEVKSLTEAETSLNELLVKFGMITWFKIIKDTEFKKFDSDIRLQFESTIYTTKISIGNEFFHLYFFKGDKRVFRKNDTNYFNKLTEALQINLNRYNNLLSLQKNERLFDLAFHSSPHPIIVIDKNYHVFQANLAAEKHNEDAEHLKCHQLLFGSSKPCIGCQLGSRFEIQKEVKTYAVQSNKFSNSIDTENNYWIHLYEDISEQKALETKFQQTAKLSEVGLISSSIAHELNNPLGGILSYLQVMKMELPADHSFQQDIHGLTEAALRMKKHIEDLLFFSRKEDFIKLEKVDLTDVFVKTLDLLNMQLKKEHLIVSFIQEDSFFHELSILHFRNIVHLVFQFFLHKLKLKRQNKSNFSGVVEVKISQDLGNSYLSFNSNLGPHDLKFNSNDLSLITLEKSLLDQGFQLVISEPQPTWLQVLIKLPNK